MTAASVLLLNVDRTPLKVISWKKAVELVLADKAEVLIGYANQLVRSMLLAMEKPAVIALKRYVRLRVKVKLSRRNILARDSHTCAYCGVKPLNREGGPDLSELTIDHVVPRSRAKEGKVEVNGKPVLATSWPNLITACYACNREKGARTPEEAGMILRFQPKRPNAWDALRISVTRIQVPHEWASFLPDSAKEWGAYWTVSLQS